jgi:hypothetical protein
MACGTAGKHHGLDFTYLEGATSHRSTRLWPEGEMYTKPSVALDKLRLRPQARSLDIPEEECSPLETEEYNKEFASPAAGSDKVK